jgi:hypothetical protein
MKKILLIISLILIILLSKAQIDTANTVVNHIDTVYIIIKINDCNCNHFIGFNEWQYNYYNWHYDFNYWCWKYNYANMHNVFWYNTHWYNKPNHEFYGRRQGNTTVTSVARRPNNSKITITKRPRTEQTHQTYKRNNRERFNNTKTRRIYNDDIYTRPNKDSNRETNSTRERTNNTIVRERHNNTEKNYTSTNQSRRR